MHRKSSKTLGEAKYVKRSALAIVLAAMVILLFATTTLAFQSMSPDGVTCTPCHTDKSGAPSPAPAPAPTPAPAPAPTVKDTVKMVAFGKSVEIKGKVSGGTVLLPLREVGNLFFAKLGWDATSNAATFVYNGKKAVVPANSATATIDDEKVELGAKTSLINGRLYVPVDFVTKVTGASQSGTAAAGLTINAGLDGYVGSETCGKCHSDSYASWQGTRHAKMLQDATDPDAWILGDFSINTFFDRDDVLFAVGTGLEGGQRYVNAVDGQLMYMSATWDAEHRTWNSASPRAYTCASCHTAGYNAETGSWVENGIGCESCHGPGAEHAKTADASKIRVNPGTEMCADCHGGDRQVGQMENMWMSENEGGHLGLFAHEIDAVDSPDYHYGDGCLGCHSATYFLAVAKDQKPPTYDDFMNGDLKDDRYGITCVVCHDPHANTGFEYQLRKDEDETCLQCHTNSRGTPSKGGTVHHPQKQAWEGIIFTGESEEPIVFGNAKQINCVDCHMTDGNHTWKPGTPTLTLTSHGKPYEANSCESCHALMTEEKVQEFTHEIEEKLHELDTKLNDLLGGGTWEEAPEAAQPYLAASVTNLNILHHEGSMGLHNPAWAKELLKQVEADLAKAEDLM